MTGHWSVTRMPGFRTCCMKPVQSLFSLVLALSQHAAQILTNPTHLQIFQHKRDCSHCLNDARDVGIMLARGDRHRNRQEMRDAPNVPLFQTAHLATARPNSNLLYLLVARPFFLIFKLHHGEYLLATNLTG